jgi:hypothetical protein
MFAATKKGFTDPFRCPRDGDDIRSLVRAIAERLLLGLAAGAPIVRLSRFDIDWIRRFLSNLA